MNAWERTRYAAGADFERKVRDTLLNVHGAVLVVRSAGSRGKVDLVAFFEPERNAWGRGDGSPVAWLVQCKRDGKLSPADHDALIQLGYDTCATPYLASRSKNGPGVVLEPLHGVVLA
jgi:hypothetical protein